MANRLDVSLAWALRCLAATAALGAVLFCFWPYNDLIDWALLKTGRPDWKEHVTTHLLTPARVLYLKAAAIMAATGLFISILFWQKAYVGLLKTAAAAPARALRWGRGALADCMAMPARYRWAFLAIFALVALRSCAYVYRFDLQYDECWTHAHFTARGPLVSAFSPHNNHILYTLVDGPFQYLPLPAEWRLRLPVVLAGLLFCFFFFVFLKKRYGPAPALVALAFVASSAPVAFYMMYARGYIFGVLFGFLAYWALLKMLQRPGQRKFKAIFVTACVLDIWSVPTHFWAVLCLGLVAFVYSLARRDSHSAKSLFGAGAIILALTLVLYAPSLLSGGLEVFLNASGQAKRGGLWAYFDHVYGWLGGGAWASWPLLAMLLAGVLLGQLRPIERALILLGGTLPLLAFAFTGVFAPERTWTFVVLFPALSLAALAAAIPPQVSTSLKAPRPSVFTLYLSLSAILGGNAYWAHHHEFLNWSKALDHWCKNASRQLLAFPVERVYTNFYYIKPRLEFDFLEHQRPLEIGLSASGSLDGVAAEAWVEYDAVLWSKEAGAFAGANTWMRVYEDPQMELYLKR